MKENSDQNDAKKVEKENSTFSSTKKFFKKLNFAQIPESDKKGSEDSKNSKSENQAPKHDHAFPMLEDFLSSDKIKGLKSRKNGLIRGIGVFTGVLLIVYGIILMMGSIDKVADNVIFGEKAVFSVFLILTGILLISGIFAHRLLDKSFFKGINKEIESCEGTSSNSTGKNIKRDNINRNNR